MGRNKKIISIGGGGFTHESDKSLDQFVLKQLNIRNLKIGFLPTASKDDNQKTNLFYKRFENVSSELSHFNLCSKIDGFKEWFLSKDLIYVGGGNTFYMLEIWKKNNLIKIIKEGYNNGIVLSGVSAGAICWFDKGVTDSWASNLNVIDCMGILSGSCCPHYNSEKDRRPSVHKFIKEDKLSSVYALEDGAAIHFKDDKPYKNISFIDDAKVFIVEKDIAEIKENVQKMYSLL